MPTHGSLTKAGKVRSQTPKITPNPKSKPIPRIHNAGNYVKRFSLNRKAGQNWMRGSRGSRVFR